MSIDRGVNLNLSLPEHGARGTDGGLGGSVPDGRSQPDAQARQRFEQAMAAPAAPKGTPDQPAAPQPFALFGSLARAAEPPAADDGLGERMAEGIARLMVGDGGSGNRQVRMELKDELLPGVSVVVQELEGRLQVDFICGNEDSRQRLDAALDANARTLAERLNRPVLLRVQTDDDEDPCLREALAFP
ncbi:MAG: hypothetical protein H3C26_00500 [Rhodocyclaceae bacterium]|nr:hypothetical protein [Rhodocyclaceae bacterium]